MSDRLPRFRWGVIAQAALVLLLVGAGGVVLLAVMLLTPRLAGSPLAIAYYGVLTASSVALVLAAAVVLRGGRRVYSRALGLALASTTLGMLIFLTIPLSIAPEVSLVHRILYRSWVATPLLLLVGTGAFLRFAVLFPRPLTPTEIGRIGEVRARDSLDRFDRSFLRALGMLPADGKGGMAEGDVAAPTRRIDRVVNRLPVPIRRIARLEVVVDGGRLVTEPRLLWSSVVLLAATPFVVFMGTDALALRFALDVGPDHPLSWIKLGIAFVTMLAIPAGWILGIALLRLGYALAGPANRRRMRWIVESLNAYAWGIIAMIPFFVLAELGIHHNAIEVAVHFLFGMLPLVVVVGIAVAVFYGGALEPTLVVRRSTLYGLFLFALAFIFAVIEELATEHLTGRLSLPDGFGTVAASGVIAVIFGGVFGRFNRRVEAYLQDPKLQAEAMAEQLTETDRAGDVAAEPQVR